jgi:vacuolar-type H+-ATPase subunit F/Vma7
MNGRVHVFASAAVAAGFRLAGVRAETPDDPRDLAHRLRAPDAGIALLLIEQPLLDAVPEAERLLLERRAVPVLIPFPAPSQRDSDASAQVLEILRRAIGYRVRLQ